jgi:hypothetical protein
MFTKPMGQFLIGLLLFVLGLGVPSSNLFDHSANLWIAFVGLLASFLFALASVIRGVKQIKSKKGSYRYNLIAIFGSSLIGILVITWAVSVFLLYLRIQQIFE